MKCVDLPIVMEDTIQFTIEKEGYNKLRYICAVSSKHINVKYKKLDITDYKIKDDIITIDFTFYEVYKPLFRKLKSKLHESRILIYDFEKQDMVVVDFKKTKHLYIEIKMEDLILI